jgi:RES domain-containing protein
MPDRPAPGWMGQVSRFHHKSVDPLSDSGAKKAGGRFNRAGRYGALYASQDRKTAEAEVEYRLGMPASNLKDFRATAIAVKLAAVLDLTNPNVQKEMGIESSEITSDKPADKEKLLKIADDARSQGFEAILALSARDPRGKNLIVFPDKLKKSSSIRVIKTEQV